MNRDECFVKLKRNLYQMQSVISWWILSNYLVPHKIYRFKWSYAQTDVVISRLVTNPLKHQTGIFLLNSEILNWEKLDGKRFELYKFDSNGAIKKKFMAYVFVLFCLSNTRKYSIEAVPNICVLSNTHSVINTKNGAYKFSELKQEVLMKDCCQNCVLVNPIRTHISTGIIRLPLSKFLTQPFLLAIGINL